MPPGTKCWTEMKTREKERLETETLSGQGHCLRSEGQEDGGYSQATYKLSLAVESRWGGSQSHSPEAPLDWH